MKDSVSAVDYVRSGKECESRFVGGCKHSRPCQKGTGDTNECRNVGFIGVRCGYILTSMFPLAFSKLSTTPSITWFIFLMPASSFRSEASLASSVSYFDSPVVALGRDDDAGVFGASETEDWALWAFFCSTRDGDANKSSVSASDRSRSFI